MQTFKEALDDGNWETVTNENGFPMYVRQLVDGIEIALEPLLFDGQMYLAVYKNQSLLFPKLPIKRGKE